MALIGKIRKNFWFVLIILGLALAAFIIMDAQSANRGNVMNPTLGNINGKKVDAQEFSRTEGILSQNSGSQDPNARRENLWNYYVNKAIVETEVEDLGITVSVEELNDLQFGQNLSPIIQQTFYNPNTGIVDRQQLAQIQNMIQTNQGMTPEFKSFWRVQENQIIASQLQSKLSNLVSKAIYTPSWLAEQEFKLKNTRAQIAYVKIPFDVIGNDAVEVTDADIKAYINKHKEQFNNKTETRVIDYITFPVIPTASDSAAVLTDMVSRTEALVAAANDSIYAVNNGGSKPTFYYSVNDLPEGLKTIISTININETYGPYLDNGVYSAIKLIDKKVIPDSVQARVIFRQAASTNPTLVANARTYRDSLKNLIVSGAASFDSIAISNSQDGSSTNGGDLGYLTQGNLPPQLDKVLFLDGNVKGKIYEAETPAGLFLIELTDIINRTTEDKYRLAYINSSVIPSQETQDSVLDIVNDFLSDNRNLGDIKTAIQGKNYDLKSSEPLDENAYTLGNLGSDQSSRNIVKWAYDASVEVGDVSPDLFTYQDPIEYYTNKYVIIGLGEIIPEGLKSVASVKDELMPLVRNIKKGEAIKAAIKGTDISAIANQYSVSVDTLSAVTMNSAVIPAIGNEPRVVSSIFSVGQNNVSAPIVGNSGVYIVKPLAIAQAGEPTNVPSLRNSSSIQNRSKVRLTLMDSLKKTAKIDDGRSKYGY